MSISPVTLSFSLLVIFTAAVTPNPPDGFPQKMRRQPVGEDKTLNEEVQQLKKELQEFARSEVQQLNKDLQEFVRRCEQDKREKRVPADALEAQLAQQAQELSVLKAQLQATENKLQSLRTGSTFVRWGRTVCPSSSQLVYSGVAGGSHTYTEGASPNRLCLTLDPQLITMSAVPGDHTGLFGAEYWEISGHHSENVPCAVCQTQHSMTIMIPATRACPSGWVTQYTGYLSGGDYDDKAGVEYACLDGYPEDRVAGSSHQVGSYFTYTVTYCGSLPCPPYENNKIVTCAVCSK